MTDHEGKDPPGYSPPVGEGTHLDGLTSSYSTPVVHDAGTRAVAGQDDHTTNPETDQLRGGNGVALAPGTRGRRG